MTAGRRWLALIACMAVEVLAGVALALTWLVIVVATCTALVTLLATAAR